MSEIHYSVLTDPFRSSGPTDRTSDRASDRVSDQSIRWEPAKENTILVMIFVRDLQNDSIAKAFVDEIRGNHSFWSILSGSDLYIWPVGWTCPDRGTPTFDEARFIEHTRYITEMLENSWRYNDHNFEQMLVVDARIHRRSVANVGPTQGDLELIVGDAVHLELRTKDRKSIKQPLREIISSIVELRRAAMQNALKDGVARAQLGTFRISDQLSWIEFKKLMFQMLTKVAKGDITAAIDTYAALRPFVAIQLKPA
jgi:hypothetical protein